MITNNSHYRCLLTHNLSSIKKLLYIILLSFYLSSWAVDSEKYYSLEAENVEYKSKESLIIAKGNVELFKKSYLLKADKVIYNKKTDKAFAYGNVVLIKPNGEELYGDSLELDNNLKEILVFELKARFKDNNVFTAKDAHTYSDKTIFNKGVYSPCKICKKSKPQWQIRSSNIEYVKKKDTVFINNFFDVYGVPSFYFPYIRVASFDSDPRSGFLFPSYYSYREIYGHGMSIPYYLRINDSNDFLYSPMFTTKHKILHSGKYRFMLQEGITNTINFEYINSKQNTNPSPSKNRFYVKSDFHHILNPNFSLKSNIEAVSDKSYLKNYHDQNVNYLKSFANLKYLGDGSRFDGTVHHFQELRDDQTDITVAPRLEYDKTIINGNSRYYIQSEATNVLKRKGGKISKANLKLDWNNDFIFHNHKIETSKTAYVDVYKFSNITSSAHNKKNYTFSRVTPEGSVAWKYPLMFSNSLAVTHLEPILKFVATPSNVHNDNIFNEDSQEIELNDSNLFINNRYSGSDRIEEGLRFNYGFVGSGEAALYKYPKYDFVFGQSYKFKKGGDYLVNSGLQDRKLSDYVGRLSFRTSSITDFHYLFQIDQKNYVFRKNEINSVFNFKFENKAINRVTLNAGLSAYDYKRNLSGIKKSASLTGTVYFLKEWYASVGMIRNIYKRKSKPIETKFSLGYKGQCTNIVLSAINNTTKDDKRGIQKGGFSYNFEIYLKNINY
ncbi:MAG: LPS-assembly protein LptD [Rickettsiales bacterium]|nr:LPS-assembly protein LptD [Rickettsiales bacterium]